MIQVDDLQLVEVHGTSAGITVNIRVQPRASRNAITGVMGGALKVSLTSPPVDGEANEACIAFFSKTLAVAKNRISITNGFKGRNKVIAIQGLTKEEFIQLLKS